MNSHYSVFSTDTEVISTGPIYVFDIDGTIANVKHRLHHVVNNPSGKKDWQAFFAAASKDTPYHWMIELMRFLPEARIVLITGRSDVISDITMRWLKQHKVPYAELRMRAQGHKAQDHQLKIEMADDYMDRIRFVVEDRQAVVNMWRDNGLNVLQCDEWKETDDHTEACTKNHTCHCVHQCVAD